MKCQHSRDHLPDSDSGHVTDTLGQRPCIGRRGSEQCHSGVISGQGSSDSSPSLRAQCPPSGESVVWTGASIPSSRVLAVCGPPSRVQRGFCSRLCSLKPAQWLSLKQNKRHVPSLFPKSLCNCTYVSQGVRNPCREEFPRARFQTFFSSFTEI